MAFGLVDPRCLQCVHGFAQTVDKFRNAFFFGFGIWVCDRMAEIAGTGVDDSRDFFGVKGEGDGHVASWWFCLDEFELLIGVPEIKPQH